MEKLQELASELIASIDSFMEWTQEELRLVKELVKELEK